jgi:putative DNA primase/helicase
VLRVEFDGRKITPGVWWTRNKDADFEGWSHGSFPSPRPLYGLDRLYDEPDRQVLIVEGEKCKDAADRLLSGSARIVPVTWMGGGKSISKVRWKSLEGRSVVIWPDNDQEGWRTVMGYVGQRGAWVKGIVEYLFEAKVKRVKIIHITPDSREDGWDIADAEPKAWTPRPSP